MDSISSWREELRQGHLDGFIAFPDVAETKGFTAAAVKLGVSASAISHAVRNVREWLGLVLFNRTTHGVSLAETGERYLKRALPATAGVAAYT